MKAAIFLMACLVSATVLADDVLQLNLALPDYSAQRTKIEKAISDDAKFVEMTSEARAMVRQSLERIAEGMGESTTLKSLDQPTQASLMALQSGINSALTTAASDSRQVCKRERVLGSNMPKRICMTAAAQRQRDKRLQDENDGNRAIRVD